MKTIDYNSREAKRIKGQARTAWQACLEANGIKETQDPNCDLSGVPDELKKLTLEELLNGDAVKIMNGVFHGTHDPTNWKPKPNEIVLVKTYRYPNKPAFYTQSKVSHIDGERVYFYDTSGIQRFVSTDIKNIRPFDVSKIGALWDEI
jgi:hypothetical protein